MGPQTSDRHKGMEATEKIRFSGVRRPPDPDGLWSMEVCGVV